MNVEILPLERACSLVTDGTHYTPPDIGKGIPFLTVKDMTDDGLDFSNCSRISQEDYERAFIGNSAPQNGDVLFSKDGTVGKVHVVNGEPDFAVLSSIAILRPNPGILDSDYLGRVLSTPYTLHQAARVKTGSALRRIILKDLKNVLVPLPPLSEQKRIAEILNKADAIRRKRAEALRLTDDFLKSSFLEMFGDPAINPKQFPKVVLQDLACEDGIKCGPFGTQLGKYEYTTKGVPLWGIKHVNSHFSLQTDEFISEEKADDLRAYTLEPGDIAMTRKGTIGNCAIYPHDFPIGIMHSDVLRLRLDTSLCLPPFLCWQFMYSRDIAHQISRISSGAVMSGINVTKLKEIHVIAPDIEIQQRFDRQLSNLSIIQSGLKKSKAELTDLFNSLVQRAFRGEL